MKFSDLSNLVSSYIRDQWVNFRRMLNEPAAREELLSGGRLYFYETGTSNHVATYMDAECSIAHCNPVICNSAGEFPDIFKQEKKIIGVKIYNESDKLIASIDPAPFGQ